MTQDEFQYIRESLDNINARLSRIESKLEIIESMLYSTKGGIYGLSASLSLFFTIVFNYCITLIKH